MISLILGNWRLIGSVLAGLAILASITVAISRYNDRIRAPLQQEIRLLQDEKKANEKRAAELLAAKIAENTQLKEKYDADAKQKDTDYAKLLARFNSRGPVGVREFTGCGSGSTGQAGTDGAGTPEKPAAESGTGPAVRELVLTEAAVGQVLQWYAYGASCHATINGK